MSGASWTWGSQKEPGKRHQRKEEAAVLCTTGGDFLKSDFYGSLHNSSQP